MNITPNSQQFLSDNWQIEKRSDLPNKGLLGHVEYWHGGLLERLPFSHSIKELLVIAASCREGESIPKASLEKLSVSELSKIFKLLDFHYKHGYPKGHISEQIALQIEEYLPIAEGNFIEPIVLAPPLYATHLILPINKFRGFC